MNLRSVWNESRALTEGWIWSFRGSPSGESCWLRSLCRIQIQPPFTLFPPVGQWPYPKTRTRFLWSHSDRGTWNVFWLPGANRL